ncbi:hypothetical protein [Paenibacillus anseongensis]|uniref:Uncharacterized protein n=1 Tax=Paenibacillus anseongense TaxID=2682845 RepID=A0ABW9UAJ4_9BACL|nr:MULTISPECIES: hypothetical protein [Paenibacillus]MVQ36239.1 hypothetical protein [Paenibacillus anseongense]
MIGRVAASASFPKKSPLLQHLPFQPRSGFGGGEDSSDYSIGLLFFIEAIGG